MHKLSVIIAAYNHENYIREMIESIFAQTFQDFEIIAVDDGSTDKTPDIISEYSDRIKFIPQKNQGVVAARMTGINASSGEYVCIVDSDDRLDPKRFEKQVKMLDANPGAGLVFSDCDIIDENGRIIGKFSENYPPYLDNIAKNLFAKYCFVPAITVMFRRSVFNSTGPLWGPGYNTDYIKWIEIAAVSDVLYINESLGSWRRHSTSVSKTMDVEISYTGTLQALSELREKNQKIREITEDVYLKRYAGLYFIIGFFSAFGGNFKKARKYFILSLKNNLFSPSCICAFLLAVPPMKFFSKSIFQMIYNIKFKWR